MSEIIVLSSFEEEPIRSKIKDFLKVQFSSFTPKYYAFSESVYKSFQTEILIPSLFSTSLLYILEKVPVSSLEKVVSSLLSLSFRPPLLLTTGYIKVADPLRKYLDQQENVLFLPLKQPADTYIASQIENLASSYSHRVDKSLLDYFLFLYRDSFSTLESDLSPFFVGMPRSSKPLSLQDFLQYRSASSFDVGYYLEKIIQKDFSFFPPSEIYPTSDIIPFLRFLSFSFLNLISSVRAPFSKVSSSWSAPEVLKMLALLRFFEIQVKLSLFSNFNMFLSAFQVKLLTLR